MRTFANKTEEDLSIGGSLTYRFRRRRNDPGQQQPDMTDLRFASVRSEFSLLYLLSSLWKSLSNHMKNNPE